MAWQGHFDKVFVGGDWASPLGAETIAVISPLTEQEIARAPSASRADVDRAVSAARLAFDSGPWPRLSVDERIATLLLRDRFVARREDMAQTITDEMGSPISFSRGLQTGVPIWMIESRRRPRSRRPFLGASCASRLPATGSFCASPKAWSRRSCPGTCR